MPMVSCGTPIRGVAIKVTDERGQELAERKVGEIALRGESMLTGYYRRPDVTAEAIRDGWYYTGDMGYIADGELYISGRKKDLVIVGGKNIYPQDLEAIANTVPGVHPGRSVAFGVADERLGTEALVMVCELEEDASPEGRMEVEREARTQGLPFGRAEKLPPLPGNLWWDRTHLTKEGGIIYNQWLAERIVQGIQNGEITNPTRGPGH